MRSRASISVPSRILPLAVAAAFVLACAVNPVTGQRELAFISESQEIAMGQSYAPQIASSMGLYDNPELQAYVESIAMPMARASERPQLPWQFEVVDESGVNAFAVPGGFIYLTRGILAHMNSEAEMAGVLGHEIGHVTAKHTVNQMSKQQLAQIGLGVGAVVLGPQAGAWVQSAGQAMQLLFLKYGRDDERQSDDLGLRYMAAAGYDPQAMVEMFRTLGRASRAAGGQRVPEWMSTHPAPENRELRIAEAIRSQGLSRSGTRANRERFLQQLDGLVYGSDPRAGFFDGQRFHHPELRFRMRFPEGWQTANQPQAVLGLSPQRDAMLQLGMAPGENAEAAARAFFNKQGVVSRNVNRTTVNGLPAVVGAFDANTQQGAVEGITLFVDHRERVYQLMGYGAKQRFAQYINVLSQSLGSFADETDPRVLGAQPWRLDIVHPRPAAVDRGVRALLPGARSGCGARADQPDRRGPALCGRRPREAGRRGSAQPVAVKKRCRPAPAISRLDLGPNSKFWLGRGS